MQNNVRYSILLALAVFSGAACADSASEQLSRIETETLVLKAREKQLDVQSNILGKQNEIVAKQALNEQLTQNAVAGDPVIRAIEGIGKTMYATLQLSNGNVLDVQAGDVLSNGMRVVSIGPNEVIVDAPKKRRIRLALAAHAQAIFNPNFPGTGLRLPPPLPAPGPATGSGGAPK